FDVLFAASVDYSLRDLVDECVRFAIENTVALLNRSQSDRLCQMTFASAGRAQKKGIFVFGNELRCRKIKDQTAIHLFVEAEIEVVERDLRITKLCLLSAPLQQPIAATR